MRGLRRRRETCVSSRQIPPILKQDASFKTDRLSIIMYRRSQKLID